MLVEKSENPNLARVLATLTETEGLEGWDWSRVTLLGSGVQYITRSGGWEVDKESTSFARRIYFEPEVFDHPWTTRGVEEAWERLLMAEFFPPDWSNPEGRQFICTWCGGSGRDLNTRDVCPKTQSYPTSYQSLIALAARGPRSLAEAEALARATQVVLADWKFAWEESLVWNVGALMRPSHNGIRGPENELLDKEGWLRKRGVSRALPPAENLKRLGYGFFRWGQTFGLEVTPFRT
jgi:hypothetical protein